MMGSEIRLLVSGSIPGGPYGDAEAATALLRELHLHTVLRVTRAENGPPRQVGSKGGAGALAELAVTGLFSATTIAAFAKVAVAFVQRGSARRIILRDDTRTLTIVDPSDDTERAVAAWLGAPRASSGAGPGAG